MTLSHDLHFPDSPGKSSSPEQIGIPLSVAAQSERVQVTDADGSLIFMPLRYVEQLQPEVCIIQTEAGGSRFTVFTHHGSFKRRN